MSRADFFEFSERLNQAFLPSSPVHTQELLAGRQAHLFDLVDMASTEGAHATIYGERGVGKTSVARVLGSVLTTTGKRVARINCSPAETFGSAWENMASELLSDSPSDREIAALTPLVGSTPLQQDVVRSLRAAVESNRLVLIFDEFDSIADDGVGEDFANLMKALADASVPSHVVVVGVAEDVDSILAGHASVGRSLHQVKMPRLGDDELRTVMDNGFGALGIEVEDDLSRRVVRLSQGLPHYTHLISKELARRAWVHGERSHVIEEDWEPALNSALAKAEQQVIDLYSSATTTAKPSMLGDLLLACALAEKDVQGFFRPVDVRPPLQSITGKNYALASYTGNLSNLASFDRGPALQSRVFADRRKRYRFANPLLQPYVLGTAVLQGRLSPDALRRI